MRHSFLLVLWVVAGTASAQVINPGGGAGGGGSDTTDWRGWTGLSLEWRPVRSLSVSFEEQWRWGENFSEFDRRFHELGFSWNPKGHPWMAAQRLSLSLRQTSRPDWRGDVQGVDRLFRWQLGYAVEAEAGRWHFAGKCRLQQQSALALKGGEDPESYGRRRETRFKGEVEYNIRGWKWDPAFSVERFLTHVPDGWRPDGAWRFRLAAGYKTGKRHKLSVFIQRDGEGRYNPAEPGVALASIGAGIDDLRTAGSVRWTVGAKWRYRLKSGGRSSKG